MSLASVAAPGLVGDVGAQAAARPRADGDGSVTVRVVRAVDDTGKYTPVLEPGMSGVTVNLTDDAGATISGTTAADGTVTLSPAGSPLTGGKYRVQALNPKPGLFHSAFADRGGLDGAPNTLSSTEEFVDLSGGKNVSYTTAFWNPGDYCQKNATLVTACIRNDVTPEPKSSRTLVSFPYNARGVNNQTTDLSTHADTGALYGIGYSKQKKWIFSGATAHRGSAYGPSGAGAIYRTDMKTNATSLFTTVPGAGGSPHDFATDMDLGFVPKVAKESLGDVEVSEDGKDLYVVNLADRKLYRYDATQPTASAPKASYAIPGPDTPCAAAGDWRPYGLGVQDGVVYVGGVCSAESSQQRSDLRAVVRTFDPAAETFGSVVMDQKLDYPRPVTYTVAPCKGAAWYPWSDTIPLKQDGITCGNTYSANPEPMLADVVVDTDGSLILGFRDRYGDQIGQAQRAVAGGGLLTPSAGGALSRACPDSTGKFVMAENMGCGKSTRGAGFYDQQRTGFHFNALFAGIALSKVETTIASSAIDPIGATFTGGTAWTNRDGSRPPEARSGNQLSSSFGKGASMADLEVLCDEAPLQIGNRVWYDVDKNGIQDPGEAPVPGVTVRLYDSTGKVVGTTVTTARGEYYFDNSNVPGDLLPRTDYTIKLDNPADYEEGGPLYRWYVTKNDAGPNRFIDSDGVVPAGGRFPEKSLTTGGPGENNHTYDFGFNQPEGEVSVLKHDKDGKPLPGAVFQLWRETNSTPGLQPDGTTPDTKVGPACTTGADGVCGATVSLGMYYWQETQAPDGYLLPDPAVFGPLDLTADNYAEGVKATAVNQMMMGDVSVLKQDKDGKPLPGAVFQLWRKTNGDGGGLKVDGPNPDTKVGDPCTTTADGLCTARQPLGEYYWQETQAPEGYLLPEPAIFGPLTLTAENHTQGTRVTAVNTLATGAVTVLKQDKDGKPLPGAVFQLWKKTNGDGGGLKIDGPNPDTKIGDPCTTPDSGVCSETVPVGTYFWQETKAPDGYLLPEPAIFGPLTLTVDNHAKGVSVTAVNQPMTGAVTVLKHDKDGKPLPGAVFQLWRETNSTPGLQPGGTAPDTKVGSACTTGADGVCTSNQPLGTYYWQETQAPDGYLLPEPAIFGPLTLTAENHTEGVRVTAVNTLATGAVTVLKHDKDGKPLPGAVFQLWKKTNGDGGGLKVDGPTPDTKIGDPCTTPANGVCTETVPLGTYYWQETKAPEGYALAQPAVLGPLTLNKDNFTQGVSVTAVNHPKVGEIRLLKKSEGDGKPLPGAVFQLWKKTNGDGGGLKVDGPTPDTKVGEPCTTDAQGVCDFRDLQLGDYYLEEISAPPGYLRSAETISGPHTVNDANVGQPVEVTRVNRKVPPPPPVPPVPPAPPGPPPAHPAPPLAKTGLPMSFSSLGALCLWLLSGGALMLVAAARRRRRT
ncbi:SpaA isopeptide-forming pilin-related protein [Amycolatopsis thailandensis]|uniref:SpaA isopeptide-forming pilin-related protein n=1 Tax=Amycolatopsis thailandensis TaxID=589330 RepID=UPI0037A33426